MHFRNQVAAKGLHRSAVFFIGLVSSIVTPTVAEIRFVDGSVTQSGSGIGGWSNAKKYLQEALADAVAEDIINIATGVYYVADGVPSGSIPTDPRDLSFVISNNILIHGGWPTQGGDTDLEAERNAIDFPVILSGDRLKDDPTDEADLAEIFDRQSFGSTSEYADNVYHVVTATGVSAATLLEGITIRGGHADGQHARGNGAGIYAPNGTPTIRSCTIEYNRAKITNPWIGEFIPDDGAGGGIYLTGGGLIDIRYCTFVSNNAYSGGGICRVPPVLATPEADVNLVGCSFIRNRCFGIASQPRPRGGGALFENGTGVIQIINCEFHNCTSDASSGEDGAGGGLVVSAPTLCSECLDSCYECSEECVAPGGCTGPPCPTCPPKVFLTNSVFMGNSGRSTGAGAIQMNRSAVIKDCTVAFNEWSAGDCLPAANATGGLLIKHDAYVKIYNSIFFGNRILGCDDPDPLLEQIDVSGAACYEVQACDIEGYSDYTGTSCPNQGDGMLDIDPLLMQAPGKGADNQWGTFDDLLGDARLGNGSDCADVGVDSLLPQADPFDLDRDGFTTDVLPVDVAYLTRKKEAGVGSADYRVDMGAHELGCPEDFNGDQTVNGTDLAELLAAWTPTGGHYLPCPSFVQHDLNRNCAVDGPDLAMVLAVWGPCGVSGLAGGGDGGEGASGGPTEESGCEGDYELFMQWAESGDWDAFQQWYQCVTGLGGGS